MAERVPLPLEIHNGWCVVERSGIYCAVDTEGNELPDNGILEHYQLVEYIGAGGSSLCYKAVDKITGRIAIIKELYPRSLTDKNLIVRRGCELYPAPEISEKDFRTVLTAYETGFKKELKSGEDVRFFMDEKTGMTNDSRFLSSADVVFKGPESALNRYQVIDTHAGVFLDKLEFSLKGRERVIDILSLEIQVLVALKILHNEKHLVHLDLKPANILVSKTYVNKEELWGNHPVILIDFGSALPIGENGCIFADRPSLSATLDYAASEVRQRQTDQIGKRSDIYSALIILQKLLLRDAGAYQYLTCERITNSQSVSSLTKTEQEMLVSFLKNGIELRKYKTAEETMEELERMIRVLKNIGVDEAIIKKHAERKAKEIAGEGRIDPDLLCSVGEPLRH